MEAKLNQQLFFKQIKSTLPQNVSLVNDVAELLNISNDCAYRRIRGDISIPFSETLALCKHYRISLDKVMNISSDSTVFHGKNIDADNFSFENYLNEILMSLKYFNSAAKKVMYYEAKDIPMFHHFQFAELASFKYFFWMKSVLYYPSYSKLSFEDCELKDVLIKTGRDIIKTYSQIPSAELWVLETANSTIHQLEYYRNTGVVKKKDTLALLYYQLEQLIEHIKEQADRGEKFLIGEKPSGTVNYQLYYNEVYLGHNAIVVEADGVQTSFINHSVLNFMFTHDKSFCDYSKKAMENNMKKSKLISSVGEREREQFFNNLLNNVQRSKNLMLG
jgi:hypothetical protein